MLSVCDCPSGEVSGIPSTKILIPLTPKLALEPNPLIDILAS